MELNLPLFIIFLGIWLVLLEWFEDTLISYYDERIPFVVRKVWHLRAFRLITTGAAITIAFLLST